MTEGSVKVYRVARVSVLSVKIQLFFVDLIGPICLGLFV